MSEKPLTFNQYEQDLVMKLVFEEYALFKLDKSAFYPVKKTFMRNRTIWISDPKFLEKNKGRRSIINLMEKGVIQRHILGYKICIRAQYLQQIYNLADAGQLELVRQLMGLWVEAKE